MVWTSSMSSSLPLGVGPGSATTTFLHESAIQVRTYFILFFSTFSCLFLFVISRHGVNVRLPSRHFRWIEAADRTHFSHLSDNHNRMIVLPINDLLYHANNLHSHQKHHECARKPRTGELSYDRSGDSDSMLRAQLTLFPFLVGSTSP